MPIGYRSATPDASTAAVARARENGVPASSEDAVDLSVFRWLLTDQGLAATLPAIEPETSVAILNAGSRSVIA